MNFISLSLNKKNTINGFLLALMIISGLDGSPTTLTVMTINTALIKLPIGIYEIFKHDVIGENKLRARQIAQAIRSMPKTPDIILFQEAFDHDAFKSEIFKNLDDIYPHHFIDTRHAWLFLGTTSGLGILSKFSLDKTVFEPFKCYFGEEMLARKGVLGVKIWLNGHPIYIFNTHMQAGGGKEFLRKMSLWIPKNCGFNDPSDTTQVAVAELEQSEKIIESMVEEPEAATILFCGDFNVASNGNDRENRYIKAIFPDAHDTFNATQSMIQTTVLENYMTGNDNTKRIDYVWIINKQENVHGSSIIIPNITLINNGNGEFEQSTDHLAVLATITIDN